MGILLLGAPPATPIASGLSGRNIINLQNFSFGTNEYAFIDHIKNGVASVSPVSNAFATGPTWPSLLDANGWPNDVAASGVGFGGGFTVPDPTNFNGPYTLDLPLGGNGAVALSLQQPFGAVGTWSASSPVNCSVTFNASGTLQVTATGGSSAASIQITFSSTLPGPQTISWVVQSTGISGSFIKQVRFYRTADATDLAAGKIWRSGWKQPLVNLCPSAIRFMNILGGNSNFNCRFENRTLPSSPGYCQYAQWDISPSYSTNATGTNQYAVAAATPTVGNPKNTPASMVHGELATVRHTNGFTRCTTDPANDYNAISVTGITNAANGVVTTNIAHGYNTGDVITHLMPLIANTVGTFNGTTSVTSVSNTTNIQIGMFVYGAGIQAGTTVANVVGSTVTLSLATTISGSNMGMAFRSMKNLHMFPCTITVTGASTYQLNVDTTAFGPFFTNGTVYACQYISMQVGSGNDRTAYPCLFDYGSTPSSFFGQYLNANDYKTWYFDKTISGRTDGSGNYIMGAWMFATTPGQNNIAHSGDFPIEVCVALINELNAMSPAHTIGMWMNIPTWGLSSMDPDYTTASDWAVNAIDVVMNPSSAVRSSGFSALGYSGATPLNQPNLIIEYSNELWPSGTNDGRAYLIARGVQRWPTILSQNNWQDLKALRSTCFVRDINASNPPGASRIKYVIGMWGSTGIFPGDFGGNYGTVFGGSVTVDPNQIGDWYTNDSLVTGGIWGSPIDNHDGVTPATYFNPPWSYYDTITGTGTFTDDSAMFNGTNNTGNGGGNYTGAANPTQAMANFVTQVVDVGNVHNSESTTRYDTVVLPQFSSVMPAGKAVLSYEGGWDWQIGVGKKTTDSYILTANDALFSAAVPNSSQWATAQVNFFDAVNAISKCFMPSIFIWINDRWAYCTPDTYATIAGTPTEGAALTVNSPVWIAMGNRNQALPN